MIPIPDPAIDLVDDPGEYIPEQYYEPSGLDLCPGCGGPEPYMPDSCCDYSWAHYAEPWWVEEVTRQMEGEQFAMSYLERDWRSRH